MDFVRFDSSLREENPGEVAEMESVVAAWEEDHSCLDPYRLPKSSELQHFAVILEPPD